MSRVSTTFLRSQLQRILLPNDDKTTWKNQLLNSNYTKSKAYYDQIKWLVDSKFKFTEQGVIDTIEKFIEYNREMKTEMKLDRMKTDLKNELKELHPNIKELQKNFTRLEDLPIGTERKQYLDILEKRKIELENELKTINGNVSIISKQIDNDERHELNCWFLNIPLDWDAFMIKLNEYQRTHMETKIQNKDIDNEPVTIYSYYKFTNPTDIKDFINQIHKVSVKPYKIYFDLDYIFEKFQAKDRDKISNPNNQDTYRYQVFYNTRPKNLPTVLKIILILINIFENLLK